MFERIHPLIDGSLYSAASLTCTVVVPCTVTSNRLPAGTFASLPFLNPQNGAAGQKRTPVTMMPVATVPLLLSPRVLLLNSSGTFEPSTAITSCIIQASVPARPQLPPFFAFVTRAVARAPRAITVAPLMMTGWTTVKLTALPSSTSADENVKMVSTSKGVPSGILIGVRTVGTSTAASSEIRFFADVEGLRP